MTKTWLGGLAGVVVVFLALMPMSGSAFREDEPVELTFTNIDGEDVPLADFEGKVVVLAFFTDCEAIGQAQALRLERMIRRRYAGGELELLGVARKGSRPESVKRLVESAGISYPVLVDARDTRSLRCPDSCALLAMVVDRQRCLAYEASGSAEGELVRVLNGLLTRTEIYLSTWGKIKELFK